MNDPKTGSAPHDCPDCGAPAYVGGPGMPCQCTNRECPFYSEDCWVLHVMELPDEEVGQELDIEDEDTQPWIKMPSFQDLYATKGRSILDGLLPAVPHAKVDPPLTPEQKKALKILDKAIDKRWSIDYNVGTDD